MKYERISKGTFLERPNRFIAYAELAGKTEVIHVKNTGRCAELLIPGASIYVQESDNPARKTKWDLASNTDFTDSSAFAMSFFSFSHFKASSSASS